jgi:Na+/proline symporter
VRPANHPHLGAVSTGWILILGGAISIIIGILQAIRPLAGMYQQVLDDPMKDAAKPEHLVGNDMLWALAWAVPGLLMFIAGKIMLKRQAARSRRR